MVLQYEQETSLLFEDATAFTLNNQIPCISHACEWSFMNTYTGKIT